MHRTRAKALSGVAALVLGFGSMQYAIDRHTPAGSRGTYAVISAAPVPSVPTLDAETGDRASEVAARDDRDAKAAEAARIEAERVAAETARKAEEARIAVLSTTTPVHPVTATTAPAAPVSVGSGACGGSLPPCWVMMRESGGNPRAVNATGCGGRGCYGKWQADPKTSQAQGYALTMDQYPEPVQDDFARGLWNNGAGCSNWAAC